MDPVTTQETTHCGSTNDRELLTVDPLTTQGTTHCVSTNDTGNYSLCVH